MAELPLDQNTAEVARATIAVDADLSEFDRQIEEAVAAFESKMNDAVGRIAENLSAKLQQALDDFESRADSVRESATGGDGGQRVDLSKIEGGVDKLVDDVEQIRISVQAIEPKVGN